MEVLCRASRLEFVSLGELGRPLAGAVDRVLLAAADRGPGVLADPGFALEVLAFAGPGSGQAGVLVGRVLDHLRTRAGIIEVSTVVLTVADAARGWEAEGLALHSPSTRATYRSWVRRLVAAHGEDDVAQVTSVDLANLIARYTRSDAGTRGPRHGRSAEESAISAFRNFWSYLLQRGAVARNIGLSLRKPFRPEPLRRAVLPDEAALLRQVSRMGIDPLLDEAALCLVERLGIRPVEEWRLRLCDVDLTRAEVSLLGKGDRPRRLPIPPGLAELLGRYVEDRRPAHLSPDVWRAETLPFLRRRPNSIDPLGRRVGVRWITNLVPRLLDVVPQLVPKGDISLYSYRHAVASWVDARHGRGMARRILGHTSRITATDHYVHVSEDAVREAICEYEEHLLAEFGS
jgi:integrase/recombinase XerC